MLLFNFLLNFLLGTCINYASTGHNFQVFAFMPLKVESCSKEHNICLLWWCFIKLFFEYVHRLCLFFAQFSGICEPLSNTLHDSQNGCAQFLVKHILLGVYVILEFFLENYFWLCAWSSTVHNFKNLCATEQHFAQLSKWRRPVWSEAYSSRGVCYPWIFLIKLFLSVCIDYASSVHNFQECVYHWATICTTLKMEAPHLEWSIFLYGCMLPIKILL
jgi:hypothetical protein